MMRVFKNRRRRILAALNLLVALGIFSASQFALAQSQRDKAVIDNFIARQMRRESATEYKEARSIVRGDLNNDGDKDVVVLYTLENLGGTNQYVQYVAVFINRRRRLLYVTHQLVGGKNRRAIDSVSIKERKINMQTEEYLPTDASCCPSKKGKVSFMLSRGKLKEV
ncbi:MAG TPA: hypothetical protein VF658_05105 [Pyrinomonadaceae bacterium]|jgi:hypothetical protein